MEKLMLNSNWGWLDYYLTMAYKAPIMCDSLEIMEKLGKWQ